MEASASNRDKAAQRGPGGSKARFGPVLGCVLCVTCAMVASSLFLPLQSLWIDETTQLYGLSLDPIKVTERLAGRADSVEGVQDDRMPPGSYWAGWLWSRVFGLSESAMRWFGVVCEAGAVALTFFAALHGFGLGGGNRSRFVPRIVA